MRVRKENTNEDQPDGTDRRMPDTDVNPGSERQDKGLKERPGTLPGEKGAKGETQGHG